MSDRVPSGWPDEKPVVSVETADGFRRVFRGEFEERWSPTAPELMDALWPPVLGGRERELLGALADASSSPEDLSLLLAEAWRRYTVFLADSGRRTQMAGNLRTAALVSAMRDRRSGWL